jgi:uncharacterized protein YaaW (UPF0174 family)
MSTLQGIVSKQLSGKVLVETARYQLAKEAFVKGGQAVATKLECQVAMLAARQGLVGAAARYMTMRSTMMMLGPLLWGTFLADVVIRSLGTDYARVIRAIFAFAQVNVPDRTPSFSMYRETHCCQVLHKGWKCCPVYLKYNSGWLAWACRFD